MGLDLVEFVMAVEERFDIEIPDEEASRLLTPRMVMDCVERHEASRHPGVLGLEHHPAKWTRRQIEEGVREIIRNELGIRAFRDDDRFVDDMEVD
jgi:acyl carrier protein